MIHVKVTKDDIKKGRLQANAHCGCPIHRALLRTLKKIISTELSLTIPNVTFAKLGKFKLILPEEAVEFQEALIDNFSTSVEPFEFDADVMVGK